MRTFIAIEIPENIRNSIHKDVEAFKASRLPVRWVARSNLHITLRFLGEITDDVRKRMSSVLEGVAARQKPFQMALKDFGCFPNPRRARVLWIGVDEGSEELSVIARNIEEALVESGFPREGRFHAHLTIGRIKKPCSIDDILNKELLSGSFEVNTLILFKSTLTPQGSIYEALEKYRFTP